MFRWTAGRASLFIPSDATVVMIPLRSGIPGPLMGEVPVEIRVDGRFLATITLTDPAAWVRQELPLGNRVTHRRFRRIQRSGRFAEITLRRRLDAVPTVAKVDLIEICLEDLILRVHLLDL